MSAAKIVGVIAAVVLTVVPASTQTRPFSSSQIQGVWRIIQTTTSLPNARTIDKSSPDLGGIVMRPGNLRVCRRDRRQAVTPAAAGRRCKSRRRRAAGHVGTLRRASRDI